MSDDCSGKGESLGTAITAVAHISKGEAAFTENSVHLFANPFG